VNAYTAPFTRKSARKFLYVVRREIAGALYPFLKDAEEADVHAEALAKGLLRGDFDKRFALTSLSLRLALRKRGYREDYIRSEIMRIRTDIILIAAPYYDFLTH